MNSFRQCQFREPHHTANALKSAKNWPKFDKEALNSKMVFNNGLNPLLKFKLGINFYGEKDLK